jgi:transmembrane sensor
MDDVRSHLEIADLIARHFNGQLSEKDKAVLEAWLKASEGNRRLWEQLHDDAGLRRQLQELPGAPVAAEAWERLQPQLQGAAPAKPVRVLYALRRYAAAIVIGILLCGGIFAYLRQRPERMPEKTRIAVTPPPAEIRPGGSKARLILAGGRTVALSDSLEQQITEKDGTQLQSRASTLTYSNDHTNTEPVYNTLETPRGGEYKVVLPDGSVAWLNAASSLRFPTKFNGSLREVTLTGEAYFEIAKNKRQPFIVRTGSISVTVTGTKFNVKAYPDEPYVNTTLVEGGVELQQVHKHGDKPVKLLPGHEGRYQNRRIVVQEARLDEALAWKNGQFVFRSEALGSIMRTLSRWYDADVSFTDTSLANVRFTGSIRKYGSIREVLDMLELTRKVNFTIHEKNIAVTNY